jgi:hypothetical protein
MPLHFSNSVTLVSCGNIECYMVILVSVGIDLGSDVHGPASSCGPGLATALAWPKIFESQSHWLRPQLLSEFSAL